MAEEMWGLRSDEVQGQSIFNLDIGLPVDKLKSSIRACMAKEKDGEETVIDATNRRGKQISVRVTCRAWSGPGEDAGVILMMEVMAA